MDGEFGQDDAARTTIQIGVGRPRLGETRAMNMCVVGGIFLALPGVCFQPWVDGS